MMARAGFRGPRLVGQRSPSVREALVQALAALGPDTDAASPAIVAIDTPATRAVQGLALNRAFARLEDATTRMRVVRLVEAVAAAEAPRGR